jgi:hypothetical protein
MKTNRLLLRYGPKWDSKIDRRWEWIQVEVDIREVWLVMWISFS